MSDSVQNLIAEPEDKGTRIDKYLSQELEDVSRSRIQKLLDDGEYRRKNKENYLVIFVDLWDMRRSPRYLIRQFKRKL